MTYSVDDFPHPHPNGLGVTINFMTWQALRLQPAAIHFNIRKSNNPYREAARGNNVFNYYFEQPEPTGIITPAPVEDPLDLPFSGHRDWTIERQKAISAFARTVIRLRPEIQAEVDSFKRQFFKGKVLAVAIRSTDKVEEYRPMKNREILEAVRGLKSELQCETVFLMTDGAGIHKIITEGVGAVSIAIPRSEKSLHHNPPRGPYMSGLWMVLDAFIAAGASHFAYTPSNAATISLIMGEKFESIHRINRHCVIEKFCPRVDRALGLEPTAK